MNPAIRARKKLEHSVVVACEQCFQRNYTLRMNKRKHPERAEFKKFCPNCNAHTQHMETR